MHAQPPSICTAGDHLHLRRLRRDDLADRYACPTLAHADVSEFRHRILMQRPASPFVISNAVRGTWLGAGTPPSGGPDRRIRRRLRRRPVMLVPDADRQLQAAVGADDQLWVVRVYRRTGISADRLAMHPLDEVVGRERPQASGVPGEAGGVEEVAPLAARAAAEERGGIAPVLRTAAGDGRAGP